MQKLQVFVPHLIVLEIASPILSALLNTCLEERGGRASREDGRIGSKRSLGVVPAFLLPCSDATNYEATSGLVVSDGSFSSATEETPLAIAALGRDTIDRRLRQREDVVVEENVSLSVS
jgi:hypothetical protein